MSSLTVPAPTLEYVPIDAHVAALEKPVTVNCSVVTFSNGASFGMRDLGVGGFFIYRQQNAAAGIEIWNDDGKQWEPDPGVAPDALKPKSFAFQAGAWQSVLIAAWQKDKNQADQFQLASPDFPYYFFRAYFRGTENGTPTSSLSAASEVIRFASIYDAVLAGIRMDEKPENATEVEFFLRSPARQIIGSVKINNGSGGNFPQILISQLDANRNLGASLTLHADGNVEITPAPGGNIILSGPVYAEQINYRPAVNGTAIGSKKWLV